MKHLRAAAFVLLVPVAAHGATVFDGSLSFTTQNQSLWSGGPGFQFEYGQFFGLDTNPAPIVINPPAASGGSGLITWSVDPYLQFDTDLRVGIGVGASVGGGTIDAKLDYAVALQTPGRIVKGEAFRLSGSAAKLGTSGFTTQAPNASAFVDGILDVYLGGYARFVTGGVLGSHDYRMGNRGFTDGATNNNPYRTLTNVNLSPEIISFNRDGGGQLKVVGVGVGGVGSTYTLGTSTSITAGDWRVSPTGTLGGGQISGTDQTTLISARVDVDRLATGGVPLLGTGFEHDWGVIAIDVGYEVVDLTATLAMGMRQQLALQSGLLVTLRFSEEVLLDGLRAMTFTGSLDSLPEITLLTDSVVVTPQFHVQANLANDTDLTFNGGLALTLIEGRARASYDFTYLFTDYKGTVIDQNIGPFYEWSDTIPLFDIGVYNEAFVLAGFQSIDGGAFTITAIPEPRVYAMFLAGLGLTLLAARRRRR